jgi:hypothetical protein
MRVVDEECVHNIEMGRVCSTHGEKMNARRFSVGKTEGFETSRETYSRWVDKIKMDPREIEWSGMNWINLTQGRDQWRVLVNTILNLRIP